MIGITKSSKLEVIWISQTIEERHRKDLLRGIYAYDEAAEKQMFSLQRYILMNTGRKYLQK